MNHLNFCMMASAVAWIYADQLKADPERRHKLKDEASFAFSDVRRIIAEATLNEDFDRLCPKPGNYPKKSFVGLCCGSDAYAAITKDNLTVSRDVGVAPTKTIGS